MRWEGIVDENEIKNTLDILKPSHQLFEVRILGSDKKKVLSGYFTDSATLIKAFDNVDLREQNIYITLNVVNEALYSRKQHDKFIANTNTTSDKEIDRYQWLFIDFDPDRPTNVSSSSEELALAEELKNKVKVHLNELCFAEPVEAISGNGYHLLYRIDLPNTDENISLVSKCLNSLAEQFNTSKVKVDTTNCNPARICKLHGTLAQKGANTENRPHRMSRILSAPAEIHVTEKSKLEELANELEEQPKPIQKKIQNVPKQEFNIRNWLTEYGFTYREDPGRECQMLLLDECPFDSNHKNGDAKVFAYNDGRIAFKCHHDSCKKYKWQDFRLKFEPDAYDKKNDDERIENGYKQHKEEKTNSIFIPLEDSEVQQAKKKKEPKKNRKLKKAADLMKLDLPEPTVYVGVGDEIPLLVEGTCILSSKPKLGKSWLVLAMCLAISNGEDFLGYHTKQCATLYLDLETSEQLQQKRIRKMLKGAEVPPNFYLDTETYSLDDGFVEQIESYIKEDPSIGVVVIDVFQIIRSSTKNSQENEYQHAYRDITPLNELAKKYHLSIILVCHDRKMVDVDDPFANILGSTGLQGAVAQMIVMFKPKKDLPIHLSVKGKTIDGIIDLNTELKNGAWNLVSGMTSDGSIDREYEYSNSNIRKAAIKLAEKGWKGKCKNFIEDAATLGIGIKEDALGVGKFLSNYTGLFLNNDKVLIETSRNGNAGKIYKISKYTIATIDTIDDEWEQCTETPFK